MNQRSLIRPCYLKMLHPTWKPSAKDMRHIELGCAIYLLQHSAMLAPILTNPRAQKRPYLNSENMWQTALNISSAFLPFHSNRTTTTAR